MNRWLNQFRLQFEKRVIDVYGNISFSSGAPTLVNSPTNNKGILSVSHPGTGLYIFTFGTNSSLPVDHYVKLLCVDAVFANSSAAPAAPVYSVRANSVSSAGTIEMAFYNLSGTLTDPADGDTLFIDFCLGDSTAP